MSLDPLAAKYPSFSPYNFVADNPIIAIDPNGEQIDIVVRKGFLGIGRKTVTVQYDAQTKTVSINEKLHGKQLKFATNVLTSLQNDIDKNSEHDSKQIDVIQSEKITEIVKGRKTEYSRDKITFNPEMGGYVGETGKDGVLDVKGSESPADILGGEIRHNWNDWDDQAAYEKRLGTPDKKWDNKEEKKVHTEYDREILGVDRKDHTAVPAKVDNVTDKPEMKDKGTTIDKKGNEVE